MAAINICSDFGAQKNKVSLCFHSFPIYLPWSNGTPWNASSFLDITEHSQGTEWRFEPILFTFYRMLEPRCLVLFHEALESKVYNESESEVTQSCLFATAWTVAYQAPPSMGFPRQEYWSGLPFPSPGDLPNPGIEPGSPALQADALPSEPLAKPLGI